MDDEIFNSIFFGSCMGRLTSIDIKVGILESFPDDEISPEAKVWIAEIREVLADHQAEKAEYDKRLDARLDRIMTPAIAAE